ncbi:hypothetical protein Taro_001724, partial [Colocasia esculenta]|nr:hypothetical protein [Colocasia esculenta]
LVSEPVLWHLGIILEREWLSRTFVRRLETLCHLSRRSLCHRMHTVFVAQHRDAPVPQGGTGKVLREFLQFQPPQFFGQPDPEIARAWLDAVERTFRSMECVPEELIMADESLRTQKFVRGLRPELRQALIVARVTDLDAAYQTATALEADTLRTRARSVEVQKQVVPTQPRQQQSSV